MASITLKGAAVIGQFRFRQAPSSDAVAIRLVWRGDQRIATVEFSDSLAQLAAYDAFPAQQGEMDLPSALSYGVFLGMYYERPVDVCGDQSVWDTRWGALRVEYSN